MEKPRNDLEEDFLPEEIEETTLDDLEREGLFKRTPRGIVLEDLE